MTTVAAAQAQSGGSASKVDWTVQGDTLAPGDTGRVAFRASIEDGWKMYAPDSPPPTVGVSVQGSVDGGAAVETKALAHSASNAAHDPNFGKTVRFFEGAARLWIPVVVSPDASAGAYPVSGALQFMVCTEEICLPPTQTSFEVPVRVAPNS